MAREDVELSLCRTGGLAGLSMVASLDTRELDVEEAQQISDALERTDFAALQGDQGSGAAPGAADTFQYDLEIRRADATQTVTFGERQTPAELKPLVRALMRRAQPGG